MKKLKGLTLLLVVAMLVSMPIAYAHDIDVDDGSIIEIPKNDGENVIYKNSVITVADSYGEYNMFYQYVPIDKEVYNSYNAILNEQIKYQEENEPGDEATDAEKQAYITTFYEYENSKRQLLPAYNDANWKQTTDGTVPLDTAGITSETQFVLWVKITEKDSGDNPIYRDKVVIYTPVTTDDEEESPKTGDNIVIFGATALLIVGIMAISYKKIKA